MKRNYFIRFHLLFLLFIAGCSYEPIEYKNDSNFTVTHAKAFFENKATDLQNVCFGLEVKSRSTDYSNITPDWKSAKITQTGKITTLEIPLGGDVGKVARTTRMSNLKTLYGFTTRVTTKLVVQKHMESETPRQFVVTMIDDWMQRGDWIGNCYGPSDYSGYVIISAVTGEYLESFQSVNGYWKRVYMAPGTREDLEDSQNASLYLLGSDASPATYNMGEGGSSRCSNCGNVLSVCTCCKRCGGVGCSECMVTVYPTCPKCGYTGPGAASGSCRCCPFCHNYPCTCGIPPDPVWYCPQCGSQYCNGNCSPEGSGSESTDPTDPDKCFHKRCPVCGKVIRTLTRASICDSHEYCENDGKCVDVQVSVSKSMVTLGDTYTITLNLTPKNTDCYDITYYMVQNGSECSLSQPNGMSTILVNMARVPGKFQIKAVIVQNETYKEYSGTTNVTQVFPARDEILRQQVVIEGIDDAWSKTLAFANSSTIREYGGVVMINTKENNDGPLYRFEAREGQPALYSDSIASVDLPICEVTFRPDQGGEFAVLLFHTHPPYWEYRGNGLHDRQLGPSTRDMEQHTTMPAIVKDFQHPTNRISTQMAKSEYVNTEKLYHYGIDRRIK